MKTYFKDLTMCGELELYLFLVFEDETSTIATFKGDFSKPVTQEFFDLFANRAAAYYEEQGFVVKGAKYISKENYEKIKDEYSSEKILVFSDNS